MSKVDRVLNKIKNLTVQEVIDLTKKLQADIGKPPEHSLVGSYPKHPRPSLKGGAEAVPDVKTQELIKAISSRGTSP